MHFALKLISHLGFAYLGAVAVFHALSRSATCRTLPMVLRGEPPKPMTIPFRTMLLTLGVVVIAANLLLLVGVVR